MLVALAFAELDRDVELFGPAVESHRDRVARTFTVQYHVDVELIADLLPINAHDDVSPNHDLSHARLSRAITATNPRRGRWAAFGSHFDQQTVLHRQIERLGKPSRYGNGLHPKVGASYFTFRDQIIRNQLGSIDRNREADSCGGSRRGINRGIDPDDFTVRIDERPPRISAVDGGVRLNRGINESSLTGLHRPAEGADHAGGKSRLKAERIADGQNLLSHLQLGRIA